MKDNKFHNEHGPAIIHESGNCFYYLDGIGYAYSSIDKWIRFCKLKAFQ